MTTTEDDRPPLEQLLDMLVYAPIGLALEAREQLPRYVERGRGQVAMARVLGRFAAAKAEEEAGRIVAAAVEGFSAPPAVPASARSNEGADGIEAAVADYDTLTAAHIVRILPTLNPEQLETVREHEAAGRNRVTVLNRIAQLLETA